MPPGHSNADRSHGLDWTTISAFFALAAGWWRGATARLAFLLTGALAACLLVNVGVNFLVNTWNRQFFDALERSDTETVGWSVLTFMGLVVAAAAVGVGVVLARETLQVRWREWLIGSILDRWLAGQRHYRMSLAQTEPANPEYRIADDTRMATEPIVDFAIGLLSSIASALTFVGVLWVVGGSIAVPFGSASITIPGYMVIAALVYGVSASVLMLYFGRKLPGEVASRNEGEARLRFELTRLRENGESVALIRGEADERRALGATYADLVLRWLRVVRRHGQITWLTNSNGVLVPVFPLLLAAPKYLSGDFTLGQVTQLAGAFVLVQVAIAWLVDHYRAIAQCYASMQRVVELTDAIDQVDEAVASPSGAGVKLVADARDGVSLVGLTIADRAGRALIRDVDLAIAAGEKALVTGESGTGKSTLVRALAGLWPWGSGAIHLPEGAAIAFVPQRAYLPAGSLREAMLYPARAADLDDAVLAGALRQAGLGHLADRLAHVERWDQILSNGERQRLAIARLLAQKPDIVILDGATTALDQEGEADLMGKLIEELGGATLIAVGLRPALEPLFDRRIDLNRAPGGARLDAVPIRRRLADSVA